MEEVEEELFSSPDNIDDEELKWRKMLKEHDDQFVPKAILKFLEKTLGLLNFQREKNMLTSGGGQMSMNNVIHHIKTAHTLINFWKNMYIFASAMKDGCDSGSDVDDFSEKGDLEHRNFLKTMNVNPVFANVKFDLDNDQGNHDSEHELSLGDSVTNYGAADEPWVIIFMAITLSFMNLLAVHLSF